MKKYLPVTCLLLGIACSSPIKITGNPDDSTFTSGTGGSAKMTTELPGKPNNVRIKADSTILRDTLMPRRN